MNSIFTPADLPMGGIKVFSIDRNSDLQDLFVNDQNVIATLAH
ncbi:hypothetical protein EV13_0080 [Prochlorococcus sp. MIT 0702]|nr:hypothetical protein EV12_2157 [Prochlorococcus sp. MIT 0701]KGG30710.1 hypothetical protein EV13_0080 [Prochlorococcus sp. MIT 0702]KGG34892.1 hypothetical protein EV14_1089 [Prochlorococcus sp. MIT 0703]